MEPGVSIFVESWYLDSGATHHTTPNDASLTKSSEYNGSGVLTVGNGASLPTSHIDSFSLATSKPLHLRNILLARNITKNLISISRFTIDNNVLVEFDAFQCSVKDKVMRQVLVRGHLHNGLYQLNVPSSLSQPTVPLAINNNFLPYGIID